MEKEVICPYCNDKALFVNSSAVYQRDYGMIYLCPRCDAYVGVHKKTNEPLGTLANAELRAWRKKAHAVFDPLWEKKLEIKQRSGEKCNKFEARNSGYKWLAQELGIDRKDCHIGMFDVETCQRVVQICTNWRKAA